MKYWKRIVSNFCFIAASVIVFVLFLHITKGFFMIAVGISFLCLVYPVMIRCGAEAISDEKNKVDMQILHDYPVYFDKKKVLMSYVKIFILCWSLSASSLFLPEGLWILTMPPLGVITFVVLKLTEHTWNVFGWKKRLYWLLSGFIAGFIFLMALIFRFGMIER